MIDWQPSSPNLDVGGTSLEEDEGKGSQEKGKQVQLCSRELGMGMDTRKWKKAVNFVFVHPKQQSTQTIACVSNHTTYL